MAADPERAGDHDAATPPGPPGLVGDRSDVVGFVDAPALGIDELVVAVVAAFRALAVGAVLTIYSDRVTAVAFTELCARCDLDLIATIPHPRGGTTFTVQERR